MYGLTHIRFKNCSEEEMMNLISKFYKDNEDTIEGMTFYEYTGTDQRFKENDKAFVEVIAGRLQVKVDTGKRTLADFP